MISRFRAPVRRFLRLPLLYKILLVNCGVTALLALIAAIVAIQHVQALPTDPHYDLVALFMAVSIIVSFVVDFLLLKLILAPLDHLAVAVNDAAQGKQHPIAPSLMSDERLDQLTAAFSGMQNTLEDNALRMRLLSQQIIHAQEEERERIARELHDEVAQTLTSVLLYLKLLEKSSDPEQAQRLQNLRKLIAHALHDLRQVAVDLHPKILDDWGLEAALGWQVNELNADGSRQVTLQVMGSSKERLPRDLELTFFHVAREALNNMVHHSSARCAQVSLKRQADWLTLEVQDDGIGFNLGAMGAGRVSSFGLASMRDRLALVDGELLIDSQPGHGTRICARAPMSTLPSQRDVPLQALGSRSE
jgi:two-component system sensor histidine kinase UhpB